MEGWMGGWFNGWMKEKDSIFHSRFLCHLHSLFCVLLIFIYLFFSFLGLNLAGFHFHFRESVHLQTLIKLPDHLVLMQTCQARCHTCGSDHARLSHTHSLQCGLHQDELWYQQLLSRILLSSPGPLTHLWLKCNKNRLYEDYTRQYCTDAFLQSNVNTAVYYFIALTGCLSLSLRPKALLAFPNLVLCSQPPLF